VTLAGPGDPWWLWAALLGAAGFGLWAEKTRWGARLSGALLTMLFAFALSNAGVIPASAPVYDVVWSWFVPLAIPLLLFRADLSRILREAGPTLLAFAAGASGTVLGTLAAFRLVPLGAEGSKMAGVLCATYVGGSINFVAVAESLGLRSGDLLSAGIAADNLVMALYFLVLFALPSITPLRRLYAQRHHEQAGRENAAGPEVLGSSRLPSLAGTVQALFAAAVFCAAGSSLAALAGYDAGRILVVTALTVAFATILPRAAARLEGAEVLGMLLMQVFFAVIGASANVAIVLRVGPSLFLFAAVIMAVHLAVILALGFLLRLDLLEIVIGSNANIGGPTTAAAMASARGWDALVLPAILTGTLGYATANFVGVAVGGWLGG